jgi:Uma2 family endonuclease
VLEDAADWQEFSEMLYDSPDRLGEQLATEVVRDGNVIQMPLPRRRSSSAEIAAVRIQEERRGKR